MNEISELTAETRYLKIRALATASSPSSTIFAT